MADVTDLILTKLDRLEKGQRQFAEVLGRVANVLEAHDHRFEQIVDRLDGIGNRLDRLIEVTTRARTQDLDRLAEIDRRLRAIEERNAPQSGG